MDSTFNICNNKSSDDFVTVALDNLSLTEVSPCESLCPQNGSMHPTSEVQPDSNCNRTGKTTLSAINKIDIEAQSELEDPYSTRNLSLTEVPPNESSCSQNICTVHSTLKVRPDLNCNKTRKTSLSVINKIDTEAQECSLTILEERRSYQSLNSTYVVPDDTSANGSEGAFNKQDTQSHSSQPKNEDCVITLYESSSSDTSIYDSSFDAESSAWLEHKNLNELSNIDNSVNSDEVSTEELSSDSEEDSSDSDEDSDSSDEFSSDSNDNSNYSDDVSSDCDSVSSMDDSDDDLTSGDSDDSDQDSSVTCEEILNSDDEFEANDSRVESSDESEESSDDHRSVDLDESSDSHSESSEDSD